MSDRVSVAIVGRHQMFADGLASWMAAFDDRLVVVCTVAAAEGLLVYPDYPVDVVILDSDRLELVRLTEHVATFESRGSRVIVVGDGVHRVISRTVLASGAFAYLSKDESAQELSDAVASAAHGQGYEPPAITASLVIGAAPHLPQLSPQEYRVMALVGDGLLVKQVAAQLGLSQDTIRTYLKRIRAKHAAVGIELKSRVDFHRHSAGHERG